jgi:hypothetical protein
MIIVAARQGGDTDLFFQVTLCVVLIKFDIMAKK